MTIHPLVATIVALSGNMTFSLGLVLQKKNVNWFGYKGPKDRSFQMARIGWITGLMFVNMSAGFNYTALLGISPNVIGAISGSNLFFTALFATLLLGDKLPVKNVFWNIILLLGIALAAYRNPSLSDSQAKPLLLYIFFLILLAASGLGLMLRKKQKSSALAIFIAGLSGALGSFTILALKGLQLTAKQDFIGWITSPFFYMFFISGTLAAVVLQFAYKDGKMSTVSPCYYGVSVLWPAFVSYFVFAVPVDLIQVAAFMIIALCVAVVSHSEAKSGSMVQEPASAESSN